MDSSWRGQALGLGPSLLSLGSLFELEGKELVLSPAHLSSQVVCVLHSDVRGATLKTRNPDVYKVHQRGTKSYLVLGWRLRHRCISKQVGGAAPYPSVIKALASVVKCTIN